MDEIADKVFEFSDKKLFSWKGNYSAYEVQKKEAFVRESAAYKNQQKEINEIKDFVSRFRNVSSKSAQAQSRLKALEKMEILKKPIPPRKPYRERTSASLQDRGKVDCIPVSVGASSVIIAYHILSSRGCRCVRTHFVVSLFFTHFNICVG